MAAVGISSVIKYRFLSSWQQPPYSEVWGSLTVEAVTSLSGKIKATSAAAMKKAGEGNQGERRT